MGVIYSETGIISLELERFILRTSHATIGGIKKMLVLN